MGFFLTILYLLFTFIRPQEYIEEIKGFPIMDILAVLSLGSVFIEGRVNSVRLTRSPTNWFVLLLLLWCGLSHLGSMHFGMVVGSWEKFAKTALVYYLVVLTVDTMPRIKLFLWVMILATILLAIQAIYVFYTGAAFGGAEALLRGEVIQARGIGIFEDPNDLGLNLVTWVPFLLPMTHRPFLSRTMWTGLICMVPVISGIAFTRSRGSLMGLAAVGWYYFYKRVGIVTSIIALVGLFAIMLAIPRMDSISTKEGSARGRMEHWSAGIDMLRKKPLTGVGHGWFIEEHYQTAHNSFVLIFAELGMIGAFIWIGMFYAAVRDINSILRDPRPPPEVHRFCDGLFGALIGWHTCAFFLSQSYKHLSFVLIALSVGMLAALDNLGIYIESRWSGVQTRNTAIFTVGGLALFYVLMRTLWNI